MFLEILMICKITKKDSPGEILYPERSKQNWNHDQYWLIVHIHKNAVHVGFVLPMHKKRIKDILLIKMNMWQHIMS